jgi:Peptide methionine sulfoxide reductase
MNTLLKIKLLPVYFLCTLFSACNYIDNGSKNTMAKLPTKLKNENVATFAQGCFWHSELVFQSLEGVREVVSGYCGGQDALPYYEKVCTGLTGHAEAVQVYYDTTKILQNTGAGIFCKPRPNQY